LLSSKVPAKTTGDLEGEGGGALGASTSLSLTLGVLGPALVPELEPLADQPIGAAPPVVARLAKIFTVEDAWREWKEGLGGRPAVQELEGK